tara:strand:+ start:1331 stop:1555 length:225 start_codon:yes stop_codon:yes gene_type:complete
MKERFQSKITTGIGVTLMLAALGLYIGSKFANYEVTVLELGGVSALGWVFLTAKDSLIEGVLLNVFRVKKEDNK